MINLRINSEFGAAQKIRHIFIELDFDSNSKDPETDLRRFYEDMPNWLRSIQRERLIFLVSVGFFVRLLNIVKNNQHTELRLNPSTDNIPSLYFRGIEIGQVDQEVNQSEIAPTESNECELKYKDFLLACDKYAEDSKIQKLI